MFSLNLKTSVEETVYSFCSQPNCTDGMYPTDSLIALKGKLYGTTGSGGSTNNGGTVFSIDLKTGAESVVYSFCQQCSDASGPDGNLLNVNGILYGTTYNGGTGTCDCGAVFSVEPVTGTEKVLYSFQGGTDGGNPAAGLIELKGKLYGTTLYGGEDQSCPGCGTVFSVDPATGSENVVHAFGTPDGIEPFVGLTRVKNELYGATVSGGSYSSGTVYQVKP
ncbi:MAG TPA: choice-of-anchor tandem repeat GloVer-containing protein [Rhizomicrobium sp.]|nr:choice-of-anchor tandem repeat GloVer-containing protein [Rhizomicrobium sp.]